MAGGLNLWGKTLGKTFRPKVDLSIIQIISQGSVGKKISLLLPSCAPNLQNLRALHLSLLLSYLQANSFVFGSYVFIVVPNQETAHLLIENTVVFK